MPSFLLIIDIFFLFVLFLFLFLKLLLVVLPCLFVLFIVVLGLVITFWYVIIVRLLLRETILLALESTIFLVRGLESFGDMVRINIICVLLVTPNVVGPL